MKSRYALEKSCKSWKSNAESYTLPLTRCCCSAQLFVFLQKSPKSVFCYIDNLLAVRSDRCISKWNGTIWLLFGHWVISNSVGRFEIKLSNETAMEKNYSLYLPCVRALIKLAE